MSHKGRFQKVGKKNKTLYGPRRLLVCGYPTEEHNHFLNFLEATGLSQLPIIFATDNDLDKELKDILNAEHKAGFESLSNMSRAIIMSGINESELQNLMGCYKKTELPGQLWATLTPYSEKWPLQQLLNELESESKAMKSKRQKG